MKHYKKLLSLLLCLTLTFTMVTVGVTAYAQDGSETTGEKEIRDRDTGTSSSGMEISKTATANDDGTYTIQLEAYATGSKVITEVTEDVPTDIVLVLDQSGSMDNPIGTITFEPYEDEKYYWETYYHTRNQDYYEVRANGENPNLYYPLGDGKYASVSVECKQTKDYTKIEDKGNSYYWNNGNNLYAKVNGEVLRVTVSRTGFYGNRTYTYTLPDNTTIATSKGTNTIPDFNSIDDNVLYLVSVDENKNVYTYTYTDTNGTTQTIGISTGASTVFGTTLYQRVVNKDAGDSRLVALQTAVTNFADNVAKKAAGKDGLQGTDDDVDHRIAIVGFASGSTYQNRNYNYGNTEVFIGSNQYKYGNEAKSVYGNAFQNMNTTKGKTNIIASIGALDGDGGTLTNLGMEMANGILTANPVSEGQKRNRVVIVFTDGVPGWSGYETTTADSAIKEAKNLKDAGTTVYTVGIFSGADASSAGTKPNNDLSNDSSNIPSAANWFMQNLSSNNGTPQNPSYYLSAADADTLNNIFQQISDQIESGGSSTSLSEETVIKDIIAPAFSLPKDADESSISIETYSCTGKTNGEYTWEMNVDAMGNADAMNAEATVDGDKVSVTGFDFAENYVGTVTENGNVSYRGDKLVIKFTVEPKAGFLGGNNVYTNTSAGVYENSSAATPILTFERPQVNVPIKDITVTVADKNVYLLGSLTGEELKNGATAKVGNVDLNLGSDVTNYGLESWQTYYVDITVVIKDTDGNSIANLSDLRNDSKYAISVVVTPKWNGAGASGTAATEKSGESTPADINVFKPELTFRDSEVYYGDNVPTTTELNVNLTKTLWKNDNTLSSDVDMIGTEPLLSKEYVLEDSKVKDGKINTKQDIAVNADVKIGEIDITADTTFSHINCSGKTCTVPKGKEFLLHVKTCQLSITKSGGAADESYVFDVYKDGVKYSEVTISGNGTETIYELPVGTYTIQEDTDWSWRYPNPSYSNGVDGVDLSKDISSGTITCTNKKDFIYWLNGFSTVVRNIFGKAN